MSAAKVALGQRLFFDPRLSVTGQHSCASCHDPARSFSDGRAQAIGATGQELPHSAMPLVNVAYNISFGWTQKNARSLEEQMREPLFNEHPVELGLKGREEAILARLSTADREMFAAAFPNEPVSFDLIIKAIAAFERTLIFGHSAFDRYVFGGEHAALSQRAKQGMALFYSERVGCAQCHSGFNFSGNWRDAQGETGAPSFKDGVRVPTLRNLSLTAPYMRDGRLQSLEAVIDHHAPPLTPVERRELLEFLKSLTSDGQ